MSTVACDPFHSALDEPAWQAVCETAAEHAQRGCGLSWDHWVTLFSSEIDAQASRLPASQRGRALEIAAQEWDYATPAERQETREWLADNGCCSHGITLGCCPAGCGS
ncbi:hypothetical protein [Acidovorax sp. MR-S7]|uniref:hypothetical protein n=1 Tax=Acidovorax sp. MR-S7 TaxID=1268622 RepID=UPI0003A2D8B1|nr:hypothetical protein [Acidovorax sp. MR-S7]GAD24646.1 conserved plasmid protein [Acidovorax sp. MR-S7]